MSSRTPRLTAAASRRRMRREDQLVLLVGLEIVARRPEEMKIRADLQPQSLDDRQQRFGAGGPIDGEMELAIAAKVLPVVAGLHSGSIARTHFQLLDLRRIRCSGSPKSPPSDSISSRTRRRSTSRSPDSGGMPIERPEITARTRAALNRCNASRTGMALTPNTSASAWMVMSWPGAISPLRINSQS